MDLLKLGMLQARLVSQGFQPSVDDLRTRELRRYLEMKQAAVFAYCISTARLNAPIAYAMVEEQDYDCVLWWKVEGKSRYAPVQLKEVVPPHLNAKATIETELAKLEKYVTSENTVVAVHLNQEGWVEYSSIEPPTTSAGEVWLYAAVTADQSRWFLYGDLLDCPRGYDIEWPTPVGYKPNSGQAAQ